MTPGAWRGEYEGREGLWLRFYDAQGALIPTRAEREAQERDAKKAALQTAGQERKAKERERAAKEAALQELERLKADSAPLTRPKATDEDDAWRVRRRFAVRPAMVAPRRISRLGVFAEKQTQPNLPAR